jgi:hypothetical protein
MSPETVVRETLPTLNVAVERFDLAARKEAFLRELRTAMKDVFEGVVVDGSRNFDSIYHLW